MATMGLNCNVDWEKFLARHDLVWEQLPEAWDEAPFLGNGLMGALLYKETGTNAIRLEVCRNDVQDHRDDSHGQPGFSRARLQIGHFLLVPEGTILCGEMRLDLWNAEARGTIKTDRGVLEIKAVVHAEEMTIMVHVAAEKGESGYHWQWHPAEAVSPRQAYGLRHRDASRILDSYVPNPPHRIAQQGKVNICVQPLLAGGETATVWTNIEANHGRTLLIHTDHSWPANSASLEAIQTLNRLADKNPERLMEAHRSWWHRYYPESFLSIPDTRLESFYWIQVYKLAAATRSDRTLIDDQGPWLAETPWPYATWNLNVQLTYWPTLASNRLHLTESLWKTLIANIDALIENVEEPYRHDSAGIGTASGLELLSAVAVPGKHTTGFVELGNLPWALHDCWLYYRMTMNDLYLKDVLYPLLRRSINYYLHFVAKEEDGKYHLMPTSSPEYGVVVKDCNYDLSLLRWGCSTLLFICDRLNLDDERVPAWSDVLQNLASYPEDPIEGFMIGQDQRYDKSHRHYSHLLMIYPLYLVHAEQSGGKDRIQKSLRHWQSRTEYLEGYSQTGASSISSSIGDGNEAYRYLNQLIEGYVTPNTMYKELGPVIETPLSGAQSIHDMLLQSWGDRIRIFPALPDGWNDAAIHDMRAEGGFLVSAIYKDGMTKVVRIKSLAGEPCRIQSNLPKPFMIKAQRDISVDEIGPGSFEIDLRKDEEIVLYTEGADGEEIRPCQSDPSSENCYGLNSKTLIAKDRGRNPQL
jgi:alpha-L-fucosidase 2